MKPKPLKERIREIMEFYGWAVYTFAMNHRIGNYTKNDFIKAMELKRTQALQAILAEIKEGMPERNTAPSGSLEDKYGYLAGQRKGWNAYHDEVEKLL